MTFQLRPYQSRATDAGKDWMRQSIDPALIDASPAAGKSFMVAELARWLREISGGGRVLCLQPNSKLVKQNLEKFLLTGEYASVFSASAGNKSTRHPVVFATPLTVKNSISRFTRSGEQRYVGVLVDECFPAGTLVGTPRGPIPINLLRNGDIVCNAVGNGKVLTTFAKSVTELYEVSFSDGRKIRCTGNHPFFTERGWVAAQELEREIVFRPQDLSGMLNCVRTGEDCSQWEGGLVSAFGGGMGQACYLFEVLRKEIEEPDALREFAKENERDADKDRPQTYDARREWSRPNGGAKSSFSSARRRVGDGACSSHLEGASQWQVPEPLQNRHCEPRADDCNRGGWRKSLHTREAGPGSPENGTVNPVRVESVARIKLASPETVYNLHVSGHPSYYAGGLLVHNCHEITPTIRAIIEEMRIANPNLRVFGFTGTPYRLGSGYIYQIGPDGKSNGEDTTRDPYFVKCVYRVPPSEMLDEGFITPMEVGEINAESYDVSKVILPNGMINHEEVERAFEGHGRKTAGAVADVIAQYHARGLKGGVMYFAATVKHAEEIYASLPQDNSALMTGDRCILRGRPATAEEIVKAYRAQEVRHLVSVGQLTTGFDVDHTVLIATLRHSESPALVTQILGRAWRLHPDKPKCLWLDYAGNVDKHFPDGDIYNPQIKARAASGPGVPVPVECPDCGHENEFNLNPEYMDYQRDQYGYCLDVFGAQIMTDHGPMPAHYGRRCFGMVRTGPKGEYDRCNYRWTGKDCEACGEKNDIAARYCYVCKAEIVNPNDKLIAEFKARKKDPTLPQTERIVSLATSESVSQRGNRTLRVDFVTEYRQFSIWLMPEPTNAKAKAQWDRWQETGGDPKTVSYVREPDSQFWRVLAYNRHADDDELPDVVMKETEKLRRYAA